MRVVAVIVCCGTVAIGPVAAQTSPVPTSIGPPPDPRLLVIGDSVILGAHGWIQRALAIRGWTVNQVSAVDMRTWQAGSIVDSYRNVGALGQVVVIQLGTNDGADVAQFASYIDGVMAHLTDVYRVYWVNLRQFRSWVPAANATIATAATRWPNLRVIDWDSMATPNPALVYGDGFHLNINGQVAMANLLGTALDAYVVEVTATVTTSTSTPTTSTTMSEPQTSSTRVIRKKESEGIPITTVLAAVAGALLFAGVVTVLATRADARRRRRRSME